MISLRKMTSEDVADVAVIARQLSVHPWSEVLFRDVLVTPYCSWVLTDDEKTVGFIVILVQSPDSELLNIAIDKNYQRKGYAKQCLQYAIEFLQSQKIDRLLLEVRTSNRAAIALYRSFGGKEISVRKGYYPAENKREDACVMEIQL